MGAPSARCANAHSDVESAFLEILGTNSLRFFKQDLVLAKDLRVMGQEFLVRGPSGSPLELPYCLFDAASKIGREQELDQCCYTKAVSETLAFDGHSFVNVHPASLLTDKAEDIITAWNNQKRKGELVLEISERHPIKEWRLLRDRIESMQKLGVKFALDDFGVGYANTRALFELPVNFVKLDAGLIAHVSQGRGARNATMYKHLVHLAKSGGTQVVGEGAETQDHLEAMIDSGCDIIQGFFFGKPMPY